MKLLTSRIGKIALMSLTLLLLISSVTVYGQPDGLSSTKEGKVYVKGVLTKDIPYPENIWKGDYGTDSTFEFGDNSTGFVGFTLQSGEISTYGSEDGYGNITASPHEITHSSYNVSGHLDISDYTETDAGSKLTLSLANVNDDANAPLAMRLNYNPAGASNTANIVKALDVSVANSKYFVLGAYVVRNTLNLSSTADYAFRVQLSDGTNVLNIHIAEHLTNLATAGSGTNEYLSFDVADGQVVFYQALISNIDGLKTTFDFTSISSITMSMNSGSDYLTGQMIVDVFAFDFVDAPLRFGVDRGDQLTSAEDYVYINATTPTSTDLDVRELDASISTIVNADIDFISEVETEDVVMNAETLRRVEEYEWKLATSTNWQDQVTLSSVSAYYIMEHDVEDYLTFDMGDDALESSLTNEVAGDAITLVTSVLEDTTYNFKMELQLTEAEYDAIVEGESSFSWNPVYWTYIVLGAIFGGSLGATARSKKRGVRTTNYNKKY